MRKHYLDNIRWMVQILVVLYHVCYMYNGLGFPSTIGQITEKPFLPADLFQYAVYPWFMTVLFIVAGISARLYLDRHTEKEFLRSRTDRLLVPSTIGLLVFGFLQGYINMALSVDAFSSLANVPLPVRYLIMAVSGTGVLWFLQVLWVLSVILILVREYEQGRLWKLGAKADTAFLIAAAVPVWLMGLVLNTPVIAVYRFGLYGTVFFLGYFVFSHDEVIEGMKKNVLIYVLAAVCAGIAFTAVHFGKNYADAPVNRSVFYGIFAWLGSLAVLAAAAKYCDFENSFTRWMSAHSFSLYVFHYLGISAVGLYIAKPGLLGPALIYPLSLLAGLAAGYVLGEIISRLPFMRWAVLGIRKKG